MKFQFKPEDFWSDDEGGLTSPFSCEFAAKKANQLLDAHIATLPEIFQSGYEWTRHIGLEKPTHRAKLWGIEEITPKICEHQAVQTGFVRFKEQYKCAKCGKPLIAKWEEV